MFNTVISATPLTSNIANSYFQNIQGQQWGADDSFLATLRALLPDRMPEDDRLMLRYMASSYTRQQVSSTSRGVLRALFSDDQSNLITIHNLSGCQQDNQAIIEMLQSSIEDIFPEWHRVQRITDFFIKSFKVLCFICPEQKSTVLFVDNLTIKRLHYLQCAIFAFLPWYFDPSKGVSPDEMELIESLRMTTSNKYEAIIAKIASRYDFRAMNIKAQLAGFEMQFERTKCEQARASIGVIDAKIDQLNRQISQYITQRRDEETLLLGLELKINQADNDSEIMEYFLSNKKLVLEYANGSHMKFIVKTDCTYFDEELVKSVINRTTSYVYNQNNESISKIPPEDIKLLMQAIFIEQKIKLQFCAAYDFDIRDCSVRGISGYYFDGEYANYMPNPHIQNYACLGNYQTTINEMLSKYDYIGAVSQCIASAESLNFADSVVMTDFMRGIYDVHNLQNKFLRLTDGRVVSPKEAVEWLQSQEDTNE